MNYFKRTIETRILQLIKDFPVIFVTGPRQSGKTTLIRRLFPDYTYYNLETPATLHQAITDPLEFLSPNKLILDEAQEAPLLFSYLLELVDTYPDKRILITGSKNLLLDDKISQSLAGRAAVLELYPFTLNEVIGQHHSALSYDKCILQGMYPRPFISRSNTFEWYNSYIRTYVQRDVRSINSIQNLAQFHTFITLLAGQVGNILNLESISNIIGLSSTTLRRWLSILEASYLVFTLMPYYSNINKRLVKRPKIYFWDTGIIMALLNIRSIEQLKTHPLYGNIFENFVIADIYKTLIHKKGGVPIYFLRDKTGHEIDLLIEDGGLHAVEIKASRTFSPVFLKNLLYFDKLLQFKTKNVIYKGKKLKVKNCALFEPKKWIEYFLSDN